MVLTEYPSAEALPATAAALLGSDFFSTRDWFGAVSAAALPAGTKPVFLVLDQAGVAAAVFAMVITRGGASSLTTPYTCLWQPAIAPGLPEAARRAIWRGFAGWCRGFATIRCDCLDEAAASAISAGLRSAGRFAPAALAFDHFGNWHTRIPAAHTASGTLPTGGFAAYLAARPGHVRETIRRRGKQMKAAGGRFSVVATADEAEAGIARYEAVYARSWKAPEPFPAFNSTLMRACARNGSLRLGLLTLGEEVLAAQFWVVLNGWAAVLKLAHDEAARAGSPGTLLTAFMIERLLSLDGVTELDFGRGDDAYKQDWADARRQRVGLILANPLRPAGQMAIVRHRVARHVRGCKAKLPARAETQNSCA